MAKPPPQQGQAGLVIFAKSVKKLSTFYIRTLGLEVQESARSHQLLRGNGYEVVVHAIPAKYAREIKIAKPPELREDSAMKPSFVVPDLQALERFILDNLTRISGIKNIKSSFALKQVKYKTALPISGQVR